MNHPLLSILRSPDPDGGAAPAPDAPVTPKTTPEPSGAATNVQGAGASAGETSAPDPSIDPLEAAVNKARGMTDTADEPGVSGSDLLDDAEFDRIAASIGAEADDAPEAPKAPAAPAPVSETPKPEQKPEPKAEAKPPASDDDIAKVIAEQYPDLADFTEVHGVVKELLDIKRQYAELAEKVNGAVGAPQAGVTAQQAQQHAASIHQAINAIPGLDTSKFGEYGRRMSPKQQQARIELDTLAANWYRQLSKESNLASLSGIELAEARYGLEIKALEAAHRQMTRNAAKAKPASDADTLSRLRHTSATRSPAAMSAGRQAQVPAITEDDDGPTAIGKVLAAHGIRTR